MEIKQGGATVATYLYDGDGQRVRSSVGSVITTYVGNWFEWTGNTNSMKKYYYAGGQRVAMRTSAGVDFLLGDHLVSRPHTSSVSFSHPQAGERRSARGAD